MKHIRPDQQELEMKTVFSAFEKFVCGSDENFAALWHSKNPEVKACELQFFFGLCINKHLMRRDIG